MSTNPQVPRPYVLSETNWKTVRDNEYRIAILPWGATEAHNYHLPYATDNIQAQAVANEAARLAWESGAATIVLPCVPFGVNTGQMDIDLCLNMNPSTQLALLEDLAEVIVYSGIDKLLILNSHGGNHFKQMIRELSLGHPDLFVAAINWWMAADPFSHFDDPGDHAGELETSTIMHLRPDWVLPLEQAGDGAAKVWKLAALREGWATAQRQWSQVTADTGVGNPAHATKQKGANFFKATTERIAEFLIELSQTENSDLYE